MALGDVLAHLSVTLGLDAGEFVTGSTKAQIAMRDLAAKFTSLGQTISKAGQAMSKSLTLPIVGLGAAAVKSAATFESALKRVQIATEASGDQMKAMTDLALKLGKDTVFSASEAASAMELLAKTGVDTETILSGAAKAVTDLAAATDSDLDPAASAISDTMAQFHLTASDLPKIVDQITGAVNESKFEFADFTGGLAQAGGTAAALGVSFEDFAAALAATSARFDSGSDSGTSFKTFLQRLNPQTKEAAGLFEEYGLAFYDAAGRMKPLAEIAQILQDKFGALSDQAKSDVLFKLFGQDALRSAIGLMDQGAAGVERVQAALAKTNAGAQAAAQMKGLGPQLQQLAGAFEALSWAIAGTGLLDAITVLVERFTGFVTWLSETHPAILKVVVAAAAFAAAIGPLTMILGGLVTTILPLFLIGLGPIATAVSALINPLGTVLALFGRMAISLAFSSGALGVAGKAIMALGAFAAPIAVPLAAIAAVGVLIYKNWDKIAPVLKSFWQAAEEALGPPLREIVASLAQIFTELWEGPLGEYIRAAIGALAAFWAAVNGALGQALIHLVKTALGSILVMLESLGKGLRVVSALLKGEWKAAWNEAAGGATSALDVIIDRVLDLLGPIGMVIRGLQRMKGLQPDQDPWYANAPWYGTGNGAAASDGTPWYGNKPPVPGADITEGAGGGGGGGSSAADIAQRAAQNAANFDAEMGRLRVDLLRAQAEYTENITQRRDVALAALDEDERAFERDLELAEDRTKAQKDQILAARRKLAEQKRANIDQEYERDLAGHQSRVAQAELQLQIDELRTRTDMATNSRDRLAGELELFDLQERQRKADLDHVLATEATTSDLWQRAKTASEWHAQTYEQRRQVVERSNQTPAQRYMESIKLNAGQLADAMDAIKIDGLDALNDGLAQAMTGARNMADVFSDVARQIIADLARIAIQKSIIGPLANALFGAAGGGFNAGALTTSTNAAINSGIASFKIPGFAKGTNFAPGGLALVGERGPELVDLPRGSRVTPNNELGGMARVTIVPSPMFEAVVDGRAARVAAPMAAAAGHHATSAAQGGMMRRGLRRIPG